MKIIQLYGAKIPAIGLGTWDLRGSECVQAVMSALEIGYRHLDTAQFYQNEEEVGKALSQSPVRREDIFLTTKVWPTYLHYQDVIATLGESLRKLRTDYVDLFLIHWPSLSVPLEETFEAMKVLLEQGKTRYIGVSNFSAEQLEPAYAMAPAPLLTNQVEYHPLLSQKEILQFCQKHEMFLTAYCPLVRGRSLQNTIIKDIASKYGKSIAQVTLRWFIQQEKVVAIPKALRPEHQKENIEIFDFELNEDEMKAISHLDRGERVVTG
ncbi:MAG: aldo/keto reductase [Candidatus Atribacteria bacterium]|nr:aldo/keto reductase [Candidatus Atribacteria bacterium]